MADAKAGHKARLTREILVKAALAIVDREGLGALSMRRLGSELGVDPMAAYRHLPNKEALLDGVMEAVVSEIDLEVDTSRPWQDQLRQLARANLDAMLAHPNAVPLLAQRPLSTASSLLLVEKAFEIMASGGVPLWQASLTVNCLGILETGIALSWTSQPADVDVAAVQQDVMASLPREMFPVLFEAVETGSVASGYEEVLDFALDTFIGRLERVPDEASGTR